MNKQHTNKLNNTRIFITGAGYLTTHLLKKWSQNESLQFVVYSRDEGKHDLINREFPNVKCVMGDIRDYDRMNRAAQGCKIGIFTASTKCIDRVEANLEESLNTIGVGAIVSKKVAQDNQFESSVFLSTDKAVLPQTSYGYLKAFASSVFLNNNHTDATKFSVVRYGNISASNKSLLDIIFNYIKNEQEITLYGEDMTRFFLDIDRGIECIEDALYQHNVTVVPKVDSFRIKDIFDIYKKEFGLRYKIGVPRLNEKIHEDIISQDEAPRTIFSPHSDNYIIHAFMSHTPAEFSNTISSKDFVISKSELHKYLLNRRFFQK